jgi:protocatechuate 3,4-dioxygenase beta subunit
LGVAGAAAMLPWGKGKATSSAFKAIQMEALLGTSGGCILIPAETEGPYPLDLSSNSSMFRQDITEGNAGTPLNLTLTLVNISDNCAPIANARIDIWHCNKDGYYSGYANQPGYLGTQSHVGATFFRGIQLTDSNGQVQFTTIYPGWYTSRVTHIHFQVFLSSVLSATSQMAFPESLTTAVYNTSPYSAHGQNSTTLSNDNVFSDAANTQYQLLTIAANGSGGYDASLTIGVSAPVTGLIEVEPETGGQFKLRTNYPNPFEQVTTVPYTLTHAAEVQFDLYDLQGRHVLALPLGRQSAGDQQLVLDRGANARTLARGTYAYQITTTNQNGTFKQCKVLTAS